MIKMLPSESTSVLNRSSGSMLTFNPIDELSLSSPECFSFIFGVRLLGVPNFLFVPLFGVLGVLGVLGVPGA